ncbi:MAG: hypothetical protein DI535_03860 [Citrobacter freundii]|nr:MAG: hypothetical protein DI535_03860 [Citrobacter freundii]
MKIKREILLNELYQFALGGNGMVVGVPGIGKSYLLGQLKQKLLADNVLCFIIKIDNTFDSSDLSIGEEMGMGENWLESLSKVELGNEHKAVLIFDGFDAARDGEKRSGFLAQIRKAKTRLKEKWNVLVSVRTYDASKSMDLQSLFSPKNTSATSNSRKITVGELTEDEIREASFGSELYDFYAGSGRELKEILHTPFFLKLLEAILAAIDSGGAEQIKQYKSETQLLDLFWEQKISATDHSLLKEKLLLSFTKQLLHNRALSLSKGELLEFWDNEGLSQLSYFLSENILNEISVRQSRVGYSHNIFFDYAVSRLCLEHSYDSLLQFIQEDHSRSFFLRPSFIYFFTSVWYEDKAVFWNLYHKLSANKSAEIKLFVRLMINATIASQFASNEDLHEILKQNGQDKGNEIIRNILQSIRFIRRNTLPQDVALLSFLSEKLQNAYLFDFAFLLDRAINEQPEDRHPSINGESARNLMRYIIANRQSDQKQFLDRIGASRGIELVSKTFASDPKASAEILRSIFPLLNEEGFEITYFSFLSEHIKYFVSIDPVLVGEIYLTIFGHWESSSAKTTFGSSVVMNLTSNRRQDFEMCYFRLAQFYPSFLAASPKVALGVGLNIINRAVQERDDLQQKDIFTFTYQGDECTFIPDYSVVWGDHHTAGKAEGLSEHINSFLETLFREGKKQEALELIHLYIRKAKVGFLWKQLMNLSNLYPEEMFEIILPLVVIPRFLSGMDTSYEVREFIKNVGSKLSDAQIAAIEAAIFQAYEKGDEYGLHAILSCLPTDRLQGSQAKKFMEGRKIMENKRPVEFSTSVSTVTTEDWLEESGVEMGDPKVIKLTRGIANLETFNNQYRNSRPGVDVYLPFVEQALALWDKLEENLHEELKFTMMNAIASTLTIASHHLEDLPELQFKKLKAVIQATFAHVSNIDRTQSASAATGIFSPTPRITATESLAYIILRDNDPVIISLYEEALNDANAIVRLYAAQRLQLLFNSHFELYQQLLFSRLTAEADAFTCAVLLGAIIFKKERVEEDGNRIMKILHQKTALLEQKNKYVDAYADLLLWFLEKDIPLADQLLKEAYDFPSFSNAVLFRLFKQIHTYEPDELFDQHLPAVERKLEIVANYIDRAGAVLLLATDITKEDPEIKNALTIFDDVVMRSFFALEKNQRLGNNQTLPADDDNRRKLYFLISPLYQKLLNYSSQITDKGLLLGHTAHYLMQTLNQALSYDPKNILSMVAEITRYSAQVGYTFDSYSIREIVSLTQKLLADHRDILMEEQPFGDLLSILDIHIHSGWVDALELLWRLDEVFK